MRLPVQSLLVVVLSFAAAVLAAPTPASAEPRPPRAVGYDVSYPQCGTRLPQYRAFAVVGVNGGLSTRPNPCLSEQLAWAWKSSGAVARQPRVQLYLNTANPGEVRDTVTTWPSVGDTPYGDCDGDNSDACSWQYGWERAQDSVLSFFGPAARAARVETLPGRYTWWLDVETRNTWQSSSSDALARNRATLEGMTAYLQSRDARVGVYSSGRQWAQIAGTVPRDSPLADLDSWVAGADTLPGARDTCERSPLTPEGRVTLTQYVEDELDRNHSCV
jgi:hypothetical protein